IVSRLAGALRVRPPTARCLVARGVIEPRDAQGFIDPRLAALRPPTGLAGMSRAVERIADAVIAGRRIAGYGFTPAAAADFAARGCEVIVTGDCGTSDLDALAVAAAHRIDVIVVDHH